jgi:hypothetical protein
MAKQSKGRKETVRRVMHIFKHGELETGAGASVKSKRQVVAIAPREAGSSREGSRRASGEDGAGKASLHAEARRKGVPGRSTMSRDELERALRR